MPRGLPQVSEQTPQPDHSIASTLTAQHGPEHSLPGPDRSDPRDASSSSRSRASGPTSDVDGVHSDSATSPAVSSGNNAVDVRKLDAKLRRLRVGSKSDAQPKKSLDAAGGSSSAPIIPGQRIAEYERASASSRGKVVFHVVKNAHGTAGTGRQLTDLPNEILTQVFSHLHRGAHDNVSLVSKRFYGIITSPHTWRLAFTRYFPSVDDSRRQSDETCASDSSSGPVRQEIRLFSRLTPMASWRSEYLLRTRLLQSVASGRPGVTAIRDGSNDNTSQSSKKAAAVITYNSKLPWMVNKMHAAFTSSGKKDPRVVHGTSDYGLATASNPTVGKLEPWGYRDMYVAAQLDEVVPHSTPYGDGNQQATVPNVMDVSHLYGAIVGEGFVGGRPLHRSTVSTAFVALEAFAPRARIPEHDHDVPYVPGNIEAISSVWIAKSTAVPIATKYAVGMLAGSSLGVVSAYSFGKADSVKRYANPQVTARWVLSPGIPIIAITADDNFSEKRKTHGRMWAVALNALGEVFHLHDVPTVPPPTPATENDQRTPSQAMEYQAWRAGRSAHWELVESTARKVGSNLFDEKQETLRLVASDSPRSSSDAMDLTPEQWVAEARAIEKFLHIIPAHFRRVYDSWDMHRKLEVDFAAGSAHFDADATGSGEHIFVIDRGNSEKEQPAKVTRYTRLVTVAGVPPSPAPASPDPAEAAGSAMDLRQNASAPATPGGGAGVLEGWNTPRPTTATIVTSGWQTIGFSLKGSRGSDINCSGIDLSLSALVAPFEDTLLDFQETTGNEIPGRRSRWMAVGTKNGTVIVWNMREPVPSSSPGEGKKHMIRPLRVIHTDSPEVSSVAMSSLYLVHGGSDGVAQAWDPLSSSKSPIRTLNSRSSGRIPPNTARTRSSIPQESFAAVGAIFLDPDPTVLRGVLAVGAFLRYWSYSATGHSSASARRRQLQRHYTNNAEGASLSSRRLNVKVAIHIAAETAEMRREQEQDARERAWLLSRYGVGLAGLSEEEALSYASLMSQDTFIDELQRSSGDSSSSQNDLSFSSGEGSNHAHSQTDGEAVSVDTVTPEPSMSGRAQDSHNAPNGSANGSANKANDDDDDFELHTQRAIRLSLMEGVNEEDSSSAGTPASATAPMTPDFDFPVTFKKKSQKASKRGGKAAATGKSAAAASSARLANEGGSTRNHAPASSASQTDKDALLKTDDSDEDDLQRAIRLSMQDEEERQRLKNKYDAVEYEAELADMYDDTFGEPEVRCKGKGRYAY